MSHQLVVSDVRWPLGGFSCQLFSLFWGHYISNWSSLVRNHQNVGAADKVRGHHEVEWPSAACLVPSGMPPHPLFKAPNTYFTSIYTYRDTQRVHTHANVEMWWSDGQPWSGALGAARGLVPCSGGEQAPLQLLFWSMLDLKYGHPLVPKPGATADPFGHLRSDYSKPDNREKNISLTYNSFFSCYTKIIVCTCVIG